MQEGTYKKKRKFFSLPTSETLEFRVARYIMAYLTGRSVSVSFFFFSFPLEVQEKKKFEIDNLFFHYITSCYTIIQFF